MPKINMTRASGGTPAIRRDQAVAGMVFAVRSKDGKLGTNYASLGHNGRFYSVNLSTGELASTEGGSKNVVPTGKWWFELTRNPTPNVVRECYRSEVANGEYFQSVTGDEVYLHIGRVERASNGFLSIPLARPGNHAIAKNPNGRVRVLGKFEMTAELSK